MIGWLTSFDTERPYRPREAMEIVQVTCGDRTDYWWARLAPKIERGEAGNEDVLEIVLLAARHLGDSIESIPVERPIHVYVCTAARADQELQPKIDPDQVVIKHWGILYPSKEDAEQS